MRQYTERPRNICFMALILSRYLHCKDSKKPTLIHHPLCNISGQTPHHKTDTMILRHRIANCRIVSSDFKTAYFYEHSNNEGKYDQFAPRLEREVFQALGIYSTSSSGGSSTSRNSASSSKSQSCRLRRAARHRRRRIFTYGSRLGYRSERQAPSANNGRRPQQSIFDHRCQRAL